MGTASQPTSPAPRRPFVAATAAALLRLISWLVYLFYLYLVLGITVAAPYGHPYAIVPMLILSCLWALSYSFIRIATECPSRGFFVRAVVIFAALRLLFGFVLVGGRPAGLVLVAQALEVPLVLGPLIELALSIWAVAVVEAGLYVLGRLHTAIGKLGRPAQAKTAG